MSGELFASMYRHSSADPGSATGPRRDLACAADQIQPFTHTDQSESVAAHRGSGIEPAALVGDVQPNLVAAPAELH